MAKMTKAQQKRMVRDILAKTKKLFIANRQFSPTSGVVNSQDMSAMEKMCNKWMKRIG